MLTPVPSQGPPPRDYLKSVDLALTLILLLRDAGALTISDVAERLDVSPSTAHRSMAMLVYRGFAIRSESRAYLPGPALSSSSLKPGLRTELVAAAEPYMQAIATETRETCHATALAEDKCHFIHSVEGSQPVRVGIRRGQIAPADEIAGGLSMLAEYSARELRALYPAMPDKDFEGLRRTLHRARERGYAINNGIFEHDVSAVGAVLHNDLGDVLGALTVAVPTSRFRHVQRKCAEVLLRHTRDLNRHLAGFRPDASAGHSANLRRSNP